MIENFQAHLPGLLVDLIFISLAAFCVFVYRTRAARLLLGSFVFIWCAVYLVLIHTNFWSQIIVDYHLYFTLYLMVFYAVVRLLTVCTGLLKFAIGLEIALHAAMVLKEPLMLTGIQIGGHLMKIDYDTYTVIYDSYPGYRITIVSLQILGLVTNGERNRWARTDFLDRLFPRVRGAMHRILSFTRRP